EKAAGLTCFERVGDPGRGLPAVRRHDGVGFEHLRDFACHSCRMDRLLYLHRFVPSLALPRAHRSELPDPCLVTVEFDPPRGRDRRAQKLAAIGHDTKVDTTAAANLLCFDIHLYNARVRRNDAVAPAGRQPNASAEQDDQISAFAATPRMGSR